MADTWPPSFGAGTGKLASGVTSLRWGTKGLLQSPYSTTSGGDGMTPTSGDGETSFYVVTRFTQRPLSENIKLQNGDGLTSTRMLLVDGMQWNITVRDDIRMTPPAINTTVTIVDAGSLLGLGQGETACQTYEATVVETDYEAAPKQPGERVLTVETLRLIEGLGRSAQD